MARGKKKEAALSPAERLEAALVPPWEQPYKVPENWRWVFCKHVTDLFNGDRGVNYPSKKDYVEEGVPFINAGTISNGLVDFSLANYITESKYSTLKKISKVALGKKKGCAPQAPRYASYLSILDAKTLDDIWN